MVGWGRGVRQSLTVYEQMLGNRQLSKAARKKKIFEVLLRSCTYSRNASTMPLGRVAGGVTSNPTRGSHVRDQPVPSVARGSVCHRRPGLALRDVCARHGHH